MSIFDLADKLFDGIEPLAPPEILTPVVDEELAVRWARVLDWMPQEHRTGLLTIQPIRLSKEVGKEPILTFNLCGQDGEDVMARFQSNGWVWDGLRREFGSVLIALEKY